MQYQDDATKGMKLRFESMGFRVWNQGFQGLISMVSGRKTLDISNEGCQEDQLKIIVRFFLQTVRFLTNVLLKIIPTLQWIFIQHDEYLYRVMNSYAQLCIVIHTYHYIFELLKAYRTLKVGRWSPCPVLQQEARVFTPLSNGERMGVGLFLWLLEDGARRPPSYYD